MIGKRKRREEEGGGGRRTREEEQEEGQEGGGGGTRKGEGRMGRRILRPEISEVGGAFFLLS